MHIETERLLISKLTPDDALFFFELVNDAEWKRFIGDRNVNTLHDAETYLKERIIPPYNNLGYGFYLVTEKETKTPLGISGFIKRDELEFADVGFAFLPVGRGKGYALESTQALMDYGKTQLGFTTILAIANADNIRSHQLLEKIGLHFDKKIRLNNESEEICLFTNNKAMNSCEN